MKSRVIRFGAVLVFAFSGFAGAQAASDWPRQGPVRMVVGFPAGGTTDVAARILADELSKRLKQSFIVDNKSGANGALAVLTVRQAKPDGYTALVSNSSSITVNPFIYKDQYFDSLTGLSPVTEFLSVPFILTVNPANPDMKDIKTLDAFIEYARKNPGVVTYGSAGIGNLAHLAGADLAFRAKVDMRHIPYRGAAPADLALQAGEIDSAFNTTGSVPAIKAGKLRALAVSTTERWPDLPDVPTVAEQGYAGFNLGFWSGVFLPPGTPAEIVDRLDQAIQEIVKDPKVGERLSLYGVPESISVKDFKAKIAEEIKQNAKLIKISNIVAQ